MTPTTKNQPSNKSTKQQCEDWAFLSEISFHLRHLHPISDSVSKDVSTNHPVFLDQLSQTPRIHLLPFLVLIKILQSLT